MALKFSEMAARRFDLARNLEAGFDNYQEEIATGYEKFVVPLLAEGETAPDAGFEIELMKRAVARSRQRLASFDSPLLDQQHEDASLPGEDDRGQHLVRQRRVGQRHMADEPASLVDTRQQDRALFRLNGVRGDGGDRMGRSQCHRSAERNQDRET